MPETKSTSWAPTAKVSVGVLAGAITLLAVRVIEHYVHVNVSADASSALKSILTFVIQYMTPERNISGHYLEDTGG